MKKEKFVYNKHTLRYEKVVEPLKVKFLRFFAFACAVAVFSVVVMAFAYSYLDSPKEKALRREIEQMKNQYKLLDQELATYEKTIESIQERDRGVHRMIFGMDPIDQDVWNGGVGGAKKYEHLARFKNSGDLMMDIAEKMDRLQHKMVVQTKSLDEISKMVNDWDNRFSSLPSIKPVREDKLKKSISLLSGFGRRLHPIHKVVKMHQGIDFTAPQGTPIIATGDGTVEEVESSGGGYGRHVLINHGYGYKTLYAHMSSFSVSQGQKVKKGQVIGKVGNTGSSTGPHLHYEVHVKGEPVNPINFVMDGLSTSEYQTLVEIASTANQSFD